MRTEVMDFLYGLKRKDADLAFDGRTKLVTKQSIDGEQCILISCEKQKLEKSLETMQVLSTIKSTIYPGSIILANADLTNGTPTEVSLEKKNGIITIDSMHKSSDSKMDSISVNETIDKLLLEYLADNKLKAQSNFSHSHCEVFSKEQVKAELGIDCDKIKLSCNFETIRSGESKAVIITFNQIYFTATCNKVANADVFVDNISVEDLIRAGIGDNNVPCYISSVSYGRSFYVCLQTSNTELDVKLAAETTIKKVTTTSNTEIHHELNEYSTTCVCVGGDPDSHIKIITGDLDEIAKVINENIDLSSTNYGYPIMYCCNYLTDNKVATINSATEYVKITRTVTHGHTLELKSNCAYVYHWNIYWRLRDVDENGNISERSINYLNNGQNKTSGWGDTIQIPANASEIHVRCVDYWWPKKTRCVLDRYVDLKNYITIKITGTTLKPGYSVTYKD